MLIRMANGRAEAIDYRETAPVGANPTMYLDASGTPMADASLVGHKAAGVPGTIAGLALAHSRFGSLKWSDLVEPARKLAADGFEVSACLVQELRGVKVLSQFQDSRRIFLKEGAYFQAGERLVQSELAATLARLQEHGPREFYEGRTAQLIADDMRAHGGLISLEDLRNYRAVVRPPLRGTYRGFDVITMPPPSSGGIALLEMLNILETFELSQMGRNAPQRFHLVIEAMRRAFADRAEFLGDPDFVEVPTAALVSKPYASRLAGSIDRSRATPSAQVGHGNPPRQESPQTTHFSIVDRDGNAVANTYTLNTEYGCGVTVRGAGFLLNNEMDDFTSKPGIPNAYGLIQSERNAIAPGKRPLSSMTPTIVLKDGKPFLVVGSPGGPTIINTVLQIILDVVDHGATVRQAVEAPRIHHQWLPDVVRHDPGGLSSDVLDGLKRVGHVLVDPEKAASFGDAQAIMIEPVTGVRLGASDPRGRGRAMGH